MGQGARCIDRPGRVRATRPAIREVPITMERIAPTMLMTIAPRRAARKSPTVRPRSSSVEMAPVSSSMQRVDDEQEEAQRHERDRQGEDPEDRPQEGVDEAEDERDEQELQPRAVRREVEVEVRHQEDGHVQAPRR